MDSNYLSILQRLKEEREQRNLTQRLLCYYMKIQQSHFSRAETGQRRFSYHELKGLCTTDVDVLYVFTGRKTSSRRKFSEKADLRPEELICLLNTLYTLTSAAWFINRKKAVFEHIHQQLEYIRCGNGHFTEKSNVFHYASVLSALYLIKSLFHKIPYRAILKRNGGGNYGKTKDLYH